ncbi:hypothetical protein DBL05_05085 [Pseudomonas putida]|nr:hypothetical protein DBL05_05085 [Pseudomonas putida]
MPSTALVSSRACPLPQFCACPVGAGLPANTGRAGAIHRVGFFAGKPAPTILGVPCRSGFTREHRQSRCHPPRWFLRGHARSHNSGRAL